MKESIYTFGTRDQVSDIEHIHKVIAVEHITDTAYILRFEKLGITFRPGQYVTVGMPGSNQLREYSIFSPVDQPYLEVLIREVEEGSVSRQLKKLTPGSGIQVEGPFGFFTLPETDMLKNKYLFIATGTGVSPFHSIIGSYPGIDFTLIHGVRYGSEDFGRAGIPSDRHILCSSRDSEGDFQGRVTEWLKLNPVDPSTRYYLCGNCDMIYDCFDILEGNGVPSDNLNAEVYF